MTEGWGSYEWDEAGRLKTVNYIDLAVVYEYDHLGRRISKTIWSWDYSKKKKLHRFVYDGWLPVAELNCDPSTGAILDVKHYLWGLDLSHTFHGAGGVGGLLAGFLPTSLALPCYDAHGTIHQYLTSSGAAMNPVAAHYDPWGLMFSGQTPQIPFGFSTKYMDWESELYYHEERYYAPWLGRFISRDPLEESGGLNLYAYCQNDPVNKWDYLGLTIGEIFVQGVGAGWAGWQIILNGETAVRIDNELYYVTGRPQEGMKVPKSGTTSVLFIYKKGEPNNLFRLDLHKPTTRNPNPQWHYNTVENMSISKVQGLTRVDHNFTRGASATGKTITIFQHGGRAMFVAGVGLSVYDIYKADNKIRETTRQVGGWAGAIGFAKAGGVIGVKIGFKVGTVLGAGPQALVTIPGSATIGGISGSIGGGVVGWVVGTKVTETVYDWAFTPLQKEEWIVCKEQSPSPLFLLK